MKLNELPKDCVSTILSLTSPVDVCRSAAASSEFRLAAQSDCVWQNFLPLDYHEIVSRADASLLKFSTRKELFFLLCNSLLIDGGKKVVYINKINGLKSYVLSARDLSIAWANDPFYWSWKNAPQSRFIEIAELRTTSWLEIHGYIKIKMLSPNTSYGAYLIFRVSKRAYGLEIMPMEVSVQVGNDLVSQNTIYMRQDDAKNKHEIQWLLYYNNRTEMLASRIDQDFDKSMLVAQGARDDGWMEIELGHFFHGEPCSDDEHNVAKMSLMEIKGHHLKGGLIVEGIEIRPLH